MSWYLALALGSTAHCCLQTPRAYVRDCTLGALICWPVASVEGPREVEDRNLPRHLVDCYSVWTEVAKPSQVRNTLAPLDAGLMIHRPAEEVRISNTGFNEKSSLGLQHSFESRGDGLPDLVVRSGTGMMKCGAY